MFVHLQSTQSESPDLSKESTMASTKLNVETSPSDARQYQFLVLPNQLRALVISDPEADKAGGAVPFLHSPLLVTQRVFAVDGRCRLLLRP